MTTPEPPSQIARLPKDKHGRPVPAFVERWSGEHEWELNDRSRALAADDWPLLAQLIGRDMNGGHPPQ